MKKGLYTIIASLFLLSLTFGLAMAGENEVEGELLASGAVTASEDGDAVASPILTFNASKGHLGAYAIKVDWDKTLANCFVRVRDLALNGDSWVAAFGRRSGARVISATNQTSGGVPFPAGTYGPYSVVNGKNTTIYVTPGRVTGGFAASMQVEINIPGKNFKYRIYRYQ